MYSRYLLDCDGHKSISRKKTKECFTKLFREYGLPQRIRTDNGVPFASNAIGRVSSLSVWWIRLGIYPELIEPGQPQQNGKHERMHRTLKKETTIPPAAFVKIVVASIIMLLLLLLCQRLYSFLLAGLARPLLGGPSYVHPLTIFQDVWLWLLYKPLCDLP